MKPQESITKNVLKNSFWISLLSILTKGGGLIFTVLLARVLLPEKFGAYSLILSVAALFMAIGDLGVNQTLVLFFSKSLVKSKAKANSYFAFLFKLKLLIISISSIILLICSYFFAKYLFGSPSLTMLFMISAFYIFFFSLSGFFASIFYIYQKAKLDFFKEFLFQTIRLCLVLVVFLLLSEQFYLIGIFVVLVLASFGMSLFSIYASKKLSPFLLSKTRTPIDKKRVLKFLSYLIIGNISLMIFSEIDVFMLGILLKNLTFVGYYKSSFALILGIGGIIAIAPILLPIFSSFKKKRIKLAFNKVMRFTLIFNIPLCFGVFVFGRYFLKVLYGEGYLEGALILYILAFLILSESITGLFSILFSAREKPVFVTKSIIFSALLNIVLNYILITSLLRVSLLWAAAGSAIATVFSRYFLMLALMNYSKKELKISFEYEYFFKPLLASLVMSIVLLAIMHYIDINLISGILLIFLGMIIYGFFMFLIGGLKKEDFWVFSLVLKKEKI